MGGASFWNELSLPGTPSPIKGRHPNFNLP
jgi:hypothetical protein